MPEWIAGSPGKVWPVVATFAAWPLPVDASLHGPALDRHLLLNLWIVSALAVLVHLLLLSGLLLRRGKEESPEKLETRGRVLRLEYLPLLGASVLFGWLAFRAERLWAATRYTGAAPQSLQVEVTGVQFAWYFHYPGDDATFGRTAPSLVDAGAGNPLGIVREDRHATDDYVSSEMVLPVGKEVDVTLRAQDVIHGFAIPELRIKQNAVPGQPMHLHFTPMREGTYAILCTQLCGLGHYRMSATLRVVSVAEFQSWQAVHQGNGAA